MHFCNFTYKAKLRTSKVETHARQKLCHFGRYDAIAKLLFQRGFVLVTQAGVFIWEIFLSRLQRSRPQNRDLGNRPRLASHMNARKFLRRIELRGEISVTEPARLTGFIS